MNENMLLIGKLEDGDKNLKPMSFTHPKHEIDCFYLIGKKNIYEMQQFSDDEHCSLFIDDFVTENNLIYLINKIDPIYLLIVSLLKNRKKSNISNKFCLSPLNQLLNDNEINHILNKLSSSNIELKQICDIKQIDDDIYCVLNDEKVINFLDFKLNKIQMTLKENISSISINIDSLNDALCILNEYIPNYYFQKLCNKYKLSPKRVINPRKRKKLNIENNDDDDLENLNGNNQQNKKRKIYQNEYENLNQNMDKMNMTHNDNNNEDDDIIFNQNKSNRNNSNNNKDKKTIKSATKSRAISKLEKVNTKGMKSMMSYFTKKKK